MCCTSLCFLFVTLKSRPFVCAHNVLQAGVSSTAPYECFTDTNMTLCSRAAISWKQVIHHFLKDHHEHANQIRCKKMCVFLCFKPSCVASPENVSCYTCITQPREPTHNMTKQMRLRKIIAKCLCMAASPAFCPNLSITAN